MATTPNYGWVTPAPTDFVTDLPADFEIFADAVDASFAADEGDLLVGGTSNIFEALPIGAAGTVLTSDGDTAEWVAAGGAADDFTLINAGGTALTGATTITVSGISGKNKLVIYVSGASAGASSNFSLQFNSDTANNYRRVGQFFNPTTGSQDILTNSITIAAQGNNASDVISAIMQIDGTNSTGIKPFNYASRANGTAFQTNNMNGFYTGSSAITSVSVLSNTGNFDAGTIFIYGA
jgi:hypothetical protein